MSIWTVLKNLSLFVSLARAIGDLVKSVSVNKGSPDKMIAKSFLESLEKLLDSGAIVIPGVDDKAISDALKLIEAQLLS